MRHSRALLALWNVQINPLPIVLRTYPIHDDLLVSAS